MTTETNAERLEQIKNKSTWLTSHNENLEDRNWLIQQAEHADKLCKLYNEQGTALSNRSHENYWLKEENARLRKALEDMKRSFNAEFAPMMTHDAKLYLSSRIDAALKGESK